MISIPNTRNYQTNRRIPIFISLQKAITVINVKKENQTVKNTDLYQSIILENVGRSKLKNSKPPHHIKTIVEKNP
ncbi:MAG: hypothetical protein GY749_38580 [Desulfobacteraceae bacterium]|nr:hypothetical protein [Desulfobacteraceae bacterium]